MTRFSDLPEDLTSRTSRVQHFIAGNLIRPTSRKTGEQRNLIYDNYGAIEGIKPNTMTKIEQRNTEGKKRIPKAKERLAQVSGMWDRAIEEVAQSNPSNIDMIRVQEAADRDIKPLQKTVDAMVNPPDLYTSRHATLAALLGKKAISWAVSGQGTSQHVPDNNRERRIEKDTERPMFLWNTAQIGESKARHRAETANLPLPQRIKERVFPWHVNVHQMTRGYGGPEEGGWWYDIGEAFGHSRGYMTQRGARKAEERLDLHFNEDNPDSISSISPSDAYQADYDQGVFDPIEYTDHGAEFLGMPSRFIQEPLDEDYDYSHFGRPSGRFRTSISRGTIGDYPKRKPHYE